MKTLHIPSTFGPVPDPPAKPGSPEELKGTPITPEDFAKKGKLS